MAIECLSCSDNFNTRRAMKIHHKMVHGQSLAIETGACRNCSEEFSYYPSEKSGIYCEECVNDENVTWGKWEHLNEYHHSFTGSENPNWDGGKEVPCEECGKKIYRNPWYLKNNEHQFCSRDCVVRFQRVTDSKIDGRGALWEKKRKQALERDGYQCQVCDISQEEADNSLHVHHIVPSRKFETEKSAHEIDNLITLCASCHPTVEHGNKTLKCVEK